MEKKMSKPLLVSYEKELVDSLSLVSLIKDSGWVGSNMVIVNCFPEYSSRIAQLVNHKLSFLNKNELFEISELRMGYPNKPQVWDSNEMRYKGYIRYLMDWIPRNILPDEKYLFVSSDASCSHFSKLKTILKTKLEPENYRFASLYTQKDSIFTPDFFVQEYEERPIFQWENTNNPNWNY